MNRPLPDDDETGVVDLSHFAIYFCLTYPLYLPTLISHEFPKEFDDDSTDKDGCETAEETVCQSSVVLDSVNPPRGSWSRALIADTIHARPRLRLRPHPR